jgi:hypothetical protein
MLRRITLVGLVACSFAAIDATAAERAAAQTFAGKTSQGYRIKVAVKGSALKILRFDIDLACSDGTLLVLEEAGFLWTKTSPNGKFHDAQFGRTDEVFFRGRLAPKSLRGRVRVTDRLGKKGIRCKSRWISFRASPR